jgi:hypothetical protein
MNRVRSLVFVAITLLVLAVSGCKTLDPSQPSGWQTGGGWENFRA